MTFRYADSTRDIAQGTQTVAYHLTGDQPFTLPGVTESDLKGQKLVESAGRLDDLLLLRRNRTHHIGRCVLGQHVVIVPPPFKNDIFIDFFAFSEAAATLGIRSGVAGEEENTNSADTFLEALAVAYVHLVTSSVLARPSKRYEETVDQLKTLRGRPLWTSDFGQHPSKGKTCRFQVLSFDNLLNNCLLAGLKVARQMIKVPSAARACERTIFHLSGMCSGKTIDSTSFDLALGSVSRLYEHYRTPLSLGKALFNKKSPGLFKDSSLVFPSIEFYLPRLFEKFTFNLIKDYARSQNLDVEEQLTSGDALIDSTGLEYRKVIPDIVISKRGIPVAVLDAKFKSRYLYGKPGQPVDKSNRVTNADIYQLFFYRSELIRSGGSPNVQSAIIAPQVDEDAPLPDFVRRKIIWQGENKFDTTQPNIHILPLPIVSIIQQLRNGKSPASSILIAGELKKFIDDAAETIP